MSINFISALNALKKEKSFISQPTIKTQSQTNHASSVDAYLERISRAQVGIVIEELF